MIRLALSIALVAYALYAIVSDGDVSVLGAVFLIFVGVCLLRR